MVLTHMCMQCGWGREGIRCLPSLHPTPHPTHSVSRALSPTRSGLWFMLWASRSTRTSSATTREGSNGAGVDGLVTEPQTVCV